MKHTPWLRLFVGATLLLAGCAQKKIATPSTPPAPVAPKSSLVLLMQDPDGKTGQVIVRNSAGTVQMDQRNSVTSISREDSAPGKPGLMEDAELKRRFGNVLSALPEAEVHYLLHFLVGGDVLTPESLALLPEIKRLIQERHSTFVSITGHTDTTDTNDANYRLGMRRAQSVAEVVKAAGVPADAVFLSSHGEGDLLVNTADNVPEAKNRRVEIVIR